MSSAQEKIQSFPSLAEKSVLESDANDGHELEESRNIDKIREIIFGGQMRDYEKRFSLLETRVIKESA